MCRGKAYFTTPYTLGQFVLMDYLNKKVADGPLMTRIAASRSFEHPTQASRVRLSRLRAAAGAEPAWNGLPDEAGFLVTEEWRGTGTVVKTPRLLRDPRGRAGAASAARAEELRAPALPAASLLPPESRRRDAAPALSSPSPCAWPRPCRLAGTARQPTRTSPTTASHLPGLRRLRLRGHGGAAAVLHGRALGLPRPHAVAGVTPSRWRTSPAASAS